MNETEQRIEELERQIATLSARLNQTESDRVGFYEIPQQDFDPTIPLAEEVHVVAQNQDAKRTDLEISWSNPDPGRIDHFELWATDLVGQNKEPYQVASVVNPPATFSVTSDQDTTGAIRIRTVTRDGLTSTLDGSPSVGFSITQTGLTASDIADGAIGNNKLDRITDPISITSADILNATISTADIGNAQITNALIGNLAVDTAQIATAAVTTAKINDLAVTNAKINDLEASKITAGSLVAGVILSSNISATQISAGTLGAGVILASNIAATQISAGTMSAVNVSAGTYTLTSGNNTMAIDGTNGFNLDNTSIDVFASLVDGEFRIRRLISDSKETFIDEDTVKGLNTSGNVVWRLRSFSENLGESNSGYLAISDSVEVDRVELGVDSSGEGLIKSTGSSTADVQSVVGSNSAVLRSSSTDADNGIYVNGTQVVSEQGATISDPSGGSTVDTEARTAINALIDRLQDHGLIA